MPIIVNVDVMLAKRKMSSGELAEKVGITPANLSILKTNKAKAIRFSTLEKICEVLDCKPGDILDYEKNIGKQLQFWLRQISFKTRLYTQSMRPCLLNFIFLAKI